MRNRKPRARARAERARHRRRDDWVDRQRRDDADASRAALLILALVGAWAAVVFSHAALGWP